MARSQCDTPLVLLGLWTISPFAFSSCPLRPELHKGLISELQNYEAHKMKPDWVGKMWWLEIWFSCRVYSPLQLNCFWVLEFYRNYSQRWLMVMIWCHSGEIPTFTISLLLGSSWEPTAWEPLLRCPLSASFQAIKNWEFFHSVY
jgi:hypothetical protein